ASAKRFRRARRSWILARVECIAAPPTALDRRLLNDRRRRCNLRLLESMWLRISPLCRRRVAALGWLILSALAPWLTIVRCGLRGGHGSVLRLRFRRRARRRRAALKVPPALLKLPIAVLQFLILPGELPDGVFEPLDAQRRIALIRLRKDLRTEGQG